MLYYIPGGTSKIAIKNQLDKLSSRWDGSEPATRAVVTGPDGQGAGVICTVGSDVDRLAINLTDQTWIAAGDRSFWFGWWNGEKPSAADLLRQETIGGSLVNGWLVPRVRKWHLFQDSPTALLELPRKPHWNGAQFVRGPVVDRFVSVADLAEEAQAALVSTYFPATLDEQTQTVSLPIDAPAIAARILAVNHRVGPDEVAALEAFEMSFESIAEILRVFVSWDQFEELVRQRQSIGDPEKKTA